MPCTVGRDSLVVNVYPWKAIGVKVRVVYNLRMCDDVDPVCRKSIVGDGWHHGRVNVNASIFACISIVGERTVLNSGYVQQVYSLVTIFFERTSRYGWIAHVHLYSVKERAFKYTVWNSWSGTCVYLNANPVLIKPGVVDINRTRSVDGQGIELFATGITHLNKAGIVELRRASRLQGNTPVLCHHASESDGIGRSANGWEGAVDKNIFVITEFYSHTRLNSERYPCVHGHICRKPVRAPCQCPHRICTYYSTYVSLSHQHRRNENTTE